MKRLKNSIVATLLAAVVAALALPTQAADEPVFVAIMRMTNVKTGGLVSKAHRKGTEYSAIRGAEQVGGPGAEGFGSGAVAGVQASGSVQGGIVGGLVGAAAGLATDAVIRGAADEDEYEIHMLGDVPGFFSSIFSAFGCPQAPATFKATRVDENIQVGDWAQLVREEGEWVLRAIGDRAAAMPSIANHRCYDTFGKYSGQFPWNKDFLTQEIQAKYAGKTKRAPTSRSSGSIHLGTLGGSD